MSYVTIPPAYYASGQPGTAYHPGGRGWLQANVDGWGENPNVSWPGAQAVNGLGADAPVAPTPPAPPDPPFSYVGRAPFQKYIRRGIAPWGAFPHGPAYAAPRPLACKGCIGTPIVPGVGALAGGCGPCEIDSGGECIPCPEGADIDECAGCVAGARPTAWYDSPLAGPIAIGIATAVGTGIVLALIRRTTHVPVG